MAESRCWRRGLPPASGCCRSKDFGTPVCTENVIRIEPVRESLHASGMIALISLAFGLVVVLFKSKSRLEADKFLS